MEISHNSYDTGKNGNPTNKSQVFFIIEGNNAEKIQ